MVFEQLFQLRLIGQPAVPQPRVHHGLLLGAGQHVFERHHGRIAAPGKLPIFVIHIGNAAAHAGGKIAPGFAEYGHRAAGHVFAAMVARALDHRRGARQAHGKTLSRNPAEKGLARGRAVQGRVANDGVLGRETTKVDAWAHDHPAPTQAFAGVVVGVADQVQSDALGQESTERLATGTFELDADGIVRQAFGPHLGQGTGKHGAQRTIDVARDFNELDFFAALDGRP